MKLRKCVEHGYTLEEKCFVCKNVTKDAHYKFVKNHEVLERAQDATNEPEAS